MKDTVNCYMEPGINDIIMTPISTPARIICQGADGSIFRIHGAKLYRRDPDSENFKPLHEINGDAFYQLLAFDHGGNLYHAGDSPGQLKRSTDYGSTFKTCLQDDGMCSFRGFAIDKSGAIYVGSYGIKGPARLYCSLDDGKIWNIIKTFQCRHIHDVAVNPISNFLYVVTGEMKDNQYPDAYGVFRSKDGGVTWTRIVQPTRLNGKGWGRPLYLAIGFLGDRIILSTDHFEGGNGLDIFIDNGEDTVFHPERVFSYGQSQDIPSRDVDHQRYCWKFINWRGHLYTVASGKVDSLLLRTADGYNWQKCAILPAMAAWSPELLPYSDKFFISVPDNESYIIQPAHHLKSPADISEPHEFWTSTLLEHDQRYGDKEDKTCCRGYYAWSIVDREKQDLILKILNEYKIPKNGMIADVGCGTGAIMLPARNAGYTRFVGIEANPRWLIGCRALYEASFPGESPSLRLIPRGNVSIPNVSGGYDAVFIIGVFSGSGNNVPPEQALTEAWRSLKKDGLLCIDVEKIFMGDKTLDIFLGLLARIGFHSIRCQPFRVYHSITALKK